jgi:DNA-binding transcriptional LysR family regulator
MHRNTFTFDLRRLRVLRELRERGTLAATAAALNLTPSAVSQQLITLSRDVGAPLLAPMGRSVRLTPQAEILLRHATVMDAQMERARADLAACDQGLAGQVALGAFSTAIAGLVSPALGRLRRERPGLRLTVLETQPPECFTHLDTGALDLVVTVDYRGGPARKDPRYHRQDLLDDPFLLALPAGHPLAGREDLDLQALAGQTWVIGAIRDPCQDVSMAACIDAGFSPDIQHRVNDWDSVFALVAEGCGVALVPLLAVIGRELPRLALRRLAGSPSPSRKIYAAIRAGADQSPLLRPVLAALAEAAGTVGAGWAEGADAPRPRPRRPAGVTPPRSGPCPRRR